MVDWEMVRSKWGRMFAPALKKVRLAPPARTHHHRGLRMRLGVARSPDIRGGSC